MSLTRLSRQWPRLRPPTPRARPQVELLEVRNLLSTSTFALTPLVQVSDPSPLPPPSSSSPTVYTNSEVEPQLAVDPTNTSHAVAVWQQDRYRSVGGARALVVSVTYNANDAAGATWSTPAPIPYFNSTDPTFNTIDPVTGQGYARYTDPWVSISPNGTVWAVALAMTPSGPVPGHTAVLVSKSTDGGSTWGAPTTLIRDDAPNGTDPADLANDKEMIVADPNNANNVYVVWDRLNHPSDQQNFNAAHGVPFREDMMFARTTDGGATWDGGGSPPAVAGYPASDVTNFQANESAFGNEIVVQPDGTLVDVFTHATGSGNQAAQADHNVVGVMRSTDHGATWSAITDGPGIEAVDVSDPDTGAPVRAGEPLVSVAVDPNKGNLYAVWADGRFSNKHSGDAVAFSMSTDGGLTWSDPIKVNQTPAGIAAFTPTVAVNSDGTVAVTYYDFRNNTSTDGIAATDYWLVHASSKFTDPKSWTGDEKRLTNTSFNIENAAPTSRGYFLGDYQGLAAAGSSFYALFAQAGASTSDPSNIFFRDPPPAPADLAASATSAAVAPSSAPSAPNGLAADALAVSGTGVFAGTSPAPGAAGVTRSGGQPSAVDPSPAVSDNPGTIVTTAASLIDVPRSGRTDPSDDGDALPGTIASDGGDDPLSA